MDEEIPPAGGQLPLRGIRKAVFFLAIVTVFAGLFGCSARPEPPDGELTVVSAAGGRMSRTDSYSFPPSARTACGCFPPSATPTGKNSTSSWRTAP